MRSLMFIVAIGVFTSVGYSATIHVPSDYAKIQKAIKAAVDGDVVLVAPGTYVEHIDFLGKAIAVKSSGGPDTTVIDGWERGSVVTFQSGEGPDSMLEGFFVTNGSGTVIGIYKYGGGIYCKDSSPTIFGNVIAKNSAGWGGGIICDTSFPIISHNLITENLAVKTSGGGGGIYCYRESSPLIENNAITRNAAFEGGGLYLGYHFASDVRNNIIMGNLATEYGGAGIHCWACRPNITNNTIYGNKVLTPYGVGGGIYCYYSSLTITNTILWNNYAGKGPEIGMESFVGTNTVRIQYSDVRGREASVYMDPGLTLIWGPGMIDDDPLFVDPFRYDFHIAFDSPCRDAGHSGAPGLPDKDFEGDPRIAHGTADMGADEFCTHLYWTGDATPGGSVELKLVGLPGTTPVQLWLGSGVLDPPWTTKYGDWYLQFPLLAQAGLGSIPSPGGVLVLPFIIPPSTPTPLPLPLQAGVGLELTNLSVLEVK